MRHMIASRDAFDDGDTLTCRRADGGGGPIRNDRTGGRVVVDDAIGTRNPPSPRFAVQRLSATRWGDHHVR